MSKQRSIRKRRAIDDEDEAEPGSEEPQQGLSAQDVKLLQRNRQRRTGVDAAALAMADTKPTAAAVNLDTAGEGAAGTDVLAAFNKERTRLADEDDPHMRRYVEEQLAKHLGRAAPREEDGSSKQPHTLEEKAMDGAGPAQRPLDTELGVAFVAGVTEVALGVEHKLRNIEATEAAKAQLLSRGGAAARRWGGGSGIADEGDDGEYGDRASTAKRAAFPVRFGKQDPQGLERLAASQAKRERGRRHAEEKKRQQQEEEVRGW